MSTTPVDDAPAAMWLYHSLDPDEGLDLRVEAVRHELEVAVRRDERDRAVVLKAGQPHTLYI